MTFVYGVKRLRDGRFRVRLPRFEHELLVSLAEQVRPVVAGEADVADVGQRLYPPAYVDADNEMEYRDLVGSSLVGERVGAFDTFAATLSRGSSDSLGWTVEIAEDELSAWLSALHDGTLVLAAVAGIQTEGDYVFDATDPNSVALDCIQGLQADVVRALMSVLPD